MFCVHNHSVINKAKIAHNLTDFDYLESRNKKGKAKVTEISEENTYSQTTAEKKPLIEIIDAYEKKIQESKPEGHKSLVEEVTGITEEGNLIINHDNKTAKVKTDVEVNVVTDVNTGTKVKKPMKRVTIKELPLTEADDGNTKDNDNGDANPKKEERKEEKSAGGTDENKSEDHRPSGKEV